jgi:hypothetical protein
VEALSLLRCQGWKKIHAGIADAGYEPTRLTQCALKKLV